jgi:ABC-type nitrate/sulfonate/bicarbonate transport system substrate-binding protein
MKPFMKRTCLTLSSAMLIAGLSAPAEAQTKFPMVTFAFTSIANVTVDIILAKELDKKNGFAVTPVTYGTGGAMWAGIAKGEAFAHSIGPYQTHKMRSEGVPIAIYGSFEAMNALVVITKDPKLTKFIDLKGKTFAATTAFTEFEYLEIYARKLGFNLRKDVNIVDATTATAQAQLAADRVDAIMAWEPSSTMILGQIPGSRVVVRGDEVWNTVAGNPGWELLLFADTEHVKKNPGILPRLVKLYQDFGEFVNNNPDEADEIVTSNKYITKNLPKGTISQAVRAKRLVFDVRPSWDPEVNKQIWQMMQIGVESGHIPSLPTKEAVVGPDSPK